MKIAMIGHKRIPSREGGIEIVVEELATRMAARGEKVYVYNRRGKHTANKSQKKVKQKDYKGVHIITIPTINRKSFDAVIYSFLSTLHSLFGHYDIIHFHAEGPASMAWIPHIFRKRIIVTIHGLDWARAKWGGFATKYLKFGEKTAAKYADEIIVLSKNVQQYFLDTYHRKVIYIPNGVEKPKKLEPDKIKMQWGLEKNSYLLFLARIVPEKGVQYLLEAYRMIDTDVKLVIAGGSSHSSEYYAKMKEIADQDPRILMSGFVQGQVLQELYSNCLAYVLPSDLEGMPLSLLEAMSFERKCIVSDIPEIQEVIGEDGYRFKASDVNDLKEKIEELLKEANSTDKDPGHYVYDMSRFDWDEVTSKHLSIYKEEKV